MKEWVKLFTGYMLVGLIAAIFGGIYSIINMYMVPTLLIQIPLALICFAACIVMWNKLNIKI